MLRSFRFSRVAIGVAFSLALLLAYVIKELPSPLTSILLSNLLQTAIVFWAACCAAYVAQRSPAYLRQLWTLLALALFLVCVAQGLESYYQSFSHIPALTPWPSDILFFLWVTPAAMMFLPPRKQGSGPIDWLQVLDFAQIGVMALAAYLYFFYIPWRWEAGGPQMVARILRLQMLRDGLLTAGFLVYASMVPVGVVRAFFLRMAVLFFLTSASPLYYLSVQAPDPFRANWSDLFWGVPYLFATAFAATWKPAREFAPQPENWPFRGKITSQVLPIFMPLLVLFMGRRIAAEQMTLAWVAVTSSFILYAGRLYLTNEKQRQIADDLRQTQRALQRSEHMFLTAFRSSPDCVGICTIPSGTFLEVNDSLARLTGYSREETVGKTPLEMNLWVDPYHRAKVMDQLQKESEVREEEFFCRTKTGQIRTCQFFGTLIDLDGERCALIIIRDITVSKQAEHALRASEERFRNLIQDLHVGVILIGPQAEAQFINRAALATFGLTEEQAIGQAGSNFGLVAIREDGLEIPFSQWPGPRSIATKQPVRNEVVGWRRAGSNEIFWTLIDAVPHLAPDGTVRRAVLSISNISERKQAEDALRASDERFRTLVREMDVGVVLHGPKAEIQFANLAAQQMFDVSLAQARGKTSADLDLICFREDGTEIPFSMRPAPRTLRTGQIIKDEVIGWRRPGSDKILWTLGNVVPQFGSDGSMVGAISTFTNITERRRVEDALHQLSTRLLQLQDEERRRLGRELHDSLAQTVLAVTLNLAKAMQSSDSLSEPSHRALTEARRLLQEMAQEIRTLSYLLHPPLLDQLGLVSAIKEYAEGFSQRSGISLGLDLPVDFGRLPQNVELALFRIVQESLANIQRHSGASSARLCLQFAGEDLILQVSDQGRGMGQSSSDLQNGRAVLLGVGILGMRERMTQLGGKLDINSNTSGTAVRATIPWKAEVFDAGSYPRRR